MIVVSFQESLCTQLWDAERDAQLVLWTSQSPEDWHVGGRTDVYLWGNGRHGQLAETGRALSTPTLGKSGFQSAKQVPDTASHVPVHAACLLADFVCRHATFQLKA